MPEGRVFTLVLFLVSAACVRSAATGRLLLAQDLESGDRAVQTGAPAAGGGLFTSRDAALGASILVSLVRPAEAIETFDEGASVTLSRDARHRNTWPRWAGRELGDRAVTLALAAGPLAYGLAAGDPKARRLGLHSIESHYAAALLTRILKTVVGRARPGTSSDPDVFKPFSGEAAFHSFPSDHAARLFALATTFAMELGDDAPWVPCWVAYSLATWTATTRVMDCAHWLTDVTAGAALGVLAARVVERLNHRGSRQPGPWLEFFPLPDGSVGLAMSFNVR